MVVVYFPDGQHTEFPLATSVARHGLNDLAVLDANQTRLALFTAAHLAGYTVNGQPPAAVQYRDPDEQTTAEQYAGIDLRNMDATYAEAKDTFADQGKRVDAITSRSTWVFTTAAGVVGAVLSQAGNLASLTPPPSTIAVDALVIGTVCAVVAAGLALAAAFVRSYQVAFRISELRLTYPDWGPTYAKVVWLAGLQDMYDANEQVIRVRIRVIIGAFAALGLSLLIIVPTAVILVWRRA